MRKALLNKTRKCAQCSKLFYMETGGWAYKKEYKKTLKHFCSWSCMRKWEKNHENPAEKREKICQAIMDGLSIREISELLDEDPRKVWHWKKKIEKEQREYGKQ